MNLLLINMYIDPRPETEVLVELYQKLTKN